MLETHGYRETDDAGPRRASLRAAARLNGVEPVVEALQKRKRSASGYRKDRIRNDVDWLRSEVGRFDPWL